MEVTVAIDCMGGDHGAGVTVPSAVDCVRRDSGVAFILVGRQDVLEAELRRCGAESGGRLAIRHAAEIVEMDEPPANALRGKKDSSMRVAVDLVKSGEAHACVSAGNTGALMAISRFVLKMLPGIDRPAIASVMPSKGNPVVFLDLGANVECSAEHLFQFAVMGEVYARAVLGVAKPRVGLLNVGTEELKGDGVVRRAASLLRDSHLEIDYAGFVEGTDVTAGTVDVVVTDGFTGNVALKIAEGTAGLFTLALKDAFKSSWRAKLGYLLAKPALQGLRDRFDPRLYNGALFLGVNGVVVKSHGGTDAIGFASAINAAVDFVHQGTNDRIIEEMGSVAGDGAPKPQAATG
jgi:phosphate acyltransferase